MVDRLGRLYKDEPENAQGHRTRLCSAQASDFYFTHSTPRPSTGPHQIDANSRKRPAL
jgi:hypothetical protein